MAQHSDPFEDMNNDSPEEHYRGSKNFLISVVLVLLAVLTFVYTSSTDPAIHVPDDAPLKHKMAPYHAATQSDGTKINVVDRFKNFMFNTKLHDANLNIYEAKEPVLFYRVRKTDAGVDGTFLNMTLSSIKDVNGKIIAQIDDILVDKKTGRATYILYSDTNDASDDGYHYINYDHVIYQEKDGDLQLTLSEDYIENTDKISYLKNDVLEKFISLKYLRQGQVMDTFGKNIGNIYAVIYDNGGLKALYFLLAPEFATGKERLISLPFKASHIALNDGGLDLQLTTAQTEHLAKTVFIKNKAVESTR